MSQSIRLPPTARRSRDDTVASCDLRVGDAPGLPRARPRNTPTPIRWSILTGEYPPQPGGVSDYTYLLARALAAAGDEVTVWVPACSGSAPVAAGVTVRRLPDHYGPAGLLALDRGLATSPKPDRILIQYVPHAYGWKAMNLPFAGWVASRARRVAPVWVMVHEVAYPRVTGQPLKHRLLAQVTRLLAWLVVGAAERVFMATAGGGDILRHVDLQDRPTEWLAVPSNIATAACPNAVAAVRERFVPALEDKLIGHFGTYGELIAELLRPVLRAVLTSSSGRAALLLGRGGPAFRDRFLDRFPTLAQRVHATGELGATDLAAHLAACDVLVQPYPDGVSTRRTSVMAGLALGRPIVTNLGANSESIWKETKCVALVSAPDPLGLIATTEGILCMLPGDRTALGAKAAAVYQSSFSLERTAAILRRERRTV